MTFELQGSKGNGNLGRKTTTAWETISMHVCVCVCVCVKQCDCSRDALKSHSEESDEGGRLERRGKGVGEEREEVGVKLR